MCFANDRYARLRAVSFATLHLLFTSTILWENFPQIHFVLNDTCGRVSLEEVNSTSLSIQIFNVVFTFHNSAKQNNWGYAYRQCIESFLTQAKRQTHRSVEYPSVWVCSLDSISRARTHATYFLANAPHNYRVWFTAHRFAPQHQSWHRLQLDSAAYSIAWGVVGSFRTQDCATIQTFRPVVVPQAWRMQLHYLSLHVSQSYCTPKLKHCCRRRPSKTQHSYIHVTNTHRSHGQQQQYTTNFVPASSLALSLHYSPQHHINHVRHTLGSRKNHAFGFFYRSTAGKSCWRRWKLNE
jgi:hypothetical protein